MKLAGIFKERAEYFAPYFATLYFVEIIYFMYLLLFVYGRFTAVIAGFTAAALLTLHIIGLYRLMNINRTIQLIIMELHFAYSVSFFVNRIFVSGTMAEGDTVMMILRIFTTAVELPLILVLTDPAGIKKYCKS